MSDDAEESARHLAEAHGLRFVDLTQSAVAPGAASLLSVEIARRYQAVPIGRRLGTPVIAVSDPGDLHAMDALRESIGREFVAVVARPDHVRKTLDELYGPSDETFAGSADSTSGSDHGAATPEPETQAESAGDEAHTAVAVADPPDGDLPSLEETSVDLAADSASEAIIEADPALSSDGSDSVHFEGADQLAQTGAYETWPESTEANGNGHDATATNNDGSSVDSGLPQPFEAGSALSHLDITPTGDLATPDVPLFNPGFAQTPVDSPSGSIASSLEESLREILSPPTRSEGPLFAPLPPVPPEDIPGTLPADPFVAPTPALNADPVTPVAPPDAPSGYGIVTSSEVDAALAYAPPLARVLVESGRVTPEEMADALREHAQTGESLARYLYNRQMATEDDLVRAMAEEVGLEFVDLNQFPINAEAASLIPEAVARNHMVLAIAIESGVPVVAMANPTDVFAMDDLRTIMGRNFTPVVATRTQIAAHLRYGGNDVDMEGLGAEAATDIGSAGSAFELESLQAVVEDAPIVRYVNLLILQALNERASDIHIEPSPRRLHVRFRIDGVMHDATSASPSIQAAVISRLKVLGDMDITERRVPQEGRVSVSVGDRQIDLRLATLPTLFGENAVMRLLDKSQSIRSLPELGFFPETLERFSGSYRHPYGVILVTGPTGAGKTTTLYATLQEVISKEKAVITVEDPVEYQITGITQVQINKKAGLSFSSALRSILRSDPDIVLIGEIRDVETATIAMEAALSGHLVLSTLHTNTAAATPLRLIEMGIEPFLVTSATTAILTQRLARLLCPQCKEPYDASEKDFVAAGFKESDLEGYDISTLYRPVGCRRCSHTGYFGRAVLAEVMTSSEEIDKLILEQASIVEIERTAVRQGMRTLRGDGLKKAIVGTTTLEEVLRVVI